MIYEPNTEETRAWLNDGGAELVLEVVRRMGHPVTVSDEWPDDSDEIAISGRYKPYVDTVVNSKKSGYEQAVAVVAELQGVNSYLCPKVLRGARNLFTYPVFNDGDDAAMGKSDLRMVLEFCDIVRFGSEAARTAKAPSGTGQAGGGKEGSRDDVL